MKFLISFFMSLIIATSATAKTPFRFVFEDQEVFPYYLEESIVQETTPGATIELIRLLEDYAEVKVSFSRLSWKRAFLALKSGRVDGMVASYKPERTTYGEFPVKDGTTDQEKRFDQSSYFLYVMKNSGVSWDPGAIKFKGVSKGIGTPVGYSIVGLLEKAGVRVDEYGNSRENLVKLAAGRLDGVALLEFDADHILMHEKSISPGVEKLSPALSSKPYYLMLSSQFIKSHPALSKQIWDACEKLRKNHRPKILQKYLRMKR